jgi:citrate synthase
MDYLGEENYIPNPVLEKALDVLFLLHADHELNASATTVLQTGSSLVDPYSAIASVVQNSSTSILHDLISYLVLAALLSSKHGRSPFWTGGANEAVIRMLISIGKYGTNLSDYKHGSQPSAGQRTCPPSLRQ